MLSCLHAPDVGQALQRGESRDRDDRGLLEGEVRGLVGELVLAGAGVLGEGPAADAEDLVADLEAGHVCADGCDSARDVESGDEVLGGAQAGEAHEVGLARHEVPCTAVQPGGVDLDQHLVVRDRRPVNLVQAQDIGGAVRGLDDHLHRQRCPAGRGCRRAHVVVSLVVGQGGGQRRGGGGPDG